MKFLLGTKKYMTEIFGDDGTVQPVTVVGIGPETVTQVKTKAKDGYDAVQVGFGSRKSSRLSKAVRGHLKGLGDLRYLREYRTTGKDEVKRGDSISTEIFKVGDFVQVRAVSKAKGFQGVVKRHGFSGGSRTHGQKHSEREPGAIGGGGRAGGRVVKGMRMAGRMGGRPITIRNVKVIDVDMQENILMLRGAVPGVRGALLQITAK